MRRRKPASMERGMHFYWEAAPIVLAIKISTVGSLISWRKRLWAVVRLRSTVAARSSVLAGWMVIFLLTSMTLTWPFGCNSAAGTGLMCPALSHITLAAQRWAIPCIRESSVG